MKIVCVSLNSKYIHSSLAPWCLKAGINAFCDNYHEFSVLESTINSDLEILTNEIIRKAPDIVAFSCYIWNITKIFPLCKTIKSKIECRIILGGPEVEYRAQEVLQNNDAVDFIVTGEGEWSFSSLINYLDGKLEIEDAEGFCFLERDKLNQIPPKKHTSTPPSPYCDEYFNNLNGRITYIEASRGCPFSCAYCLSGQLQGLRYFDTDSVFDSIVKLSHSGTKTIKFIDRTFNADASKADAILNHIKNQYGKTIISDVCFHFEIAGDILKESTMEILKSMPKGLCQLEIGIQSFNNKTLSAINRRSDSKKLISNISRLISFGNMHIHTDLIAGLPFEDISSFKNSFNLAFSLKPNMLQLGFLKLLHGADMRENKTQFPCEFSPFPPYEITSNEWLSADEIKTLKCCEQALDRLYNSGRFLLTLEYLFEEIKLDPFEAFCEFGSFFDFNKISLTDFTQNLWDFFKTECDSEILREKILCDLNSIPANIHISDSLIIYDPSYKSLKKRFSELLKKNVRIVILNSINKVFVVHTDKQDKINGRFYSEYYDI